LEEIDSEEIARQLTILDFAAWKNCAAREALKWVKTKNKAVESPNIVHFIEAYVEPPARERNSEA
jgi:hypothetical protein